MTMDRYFSIHAFFFHSWRATLYGIVIHVRHFTLSFVFKRRERLWAFDVMDISYAIMKVCLLTTICFICIYK